MATPRDPTWSEFVESLCPPVRELPAGKRPGGWVEGPVTMEVSKAVEEELPATETTAPARLEDPPLLYEMQFTTTAEHAELLERARALLSRRSPKMSLGDLHLHAMRLLVQRLETERYGAETESRKEPPREVAERDGTDSECDDASPGGEPAAALATHVAGATHLALVEENRRSGCSRLGASLATLYRA